jgi:GT2 family glycosyltransferase
MKKITIIIIHYGSQKNTIEALNSLKNKISKNQLILINNTSEDISNLVKIIPHTKLINNLKNLGFAQAVNQGITLGLTDNKITHFLLLNNDLQLSQGTLDQLLLTFDKHSDTGIVSPALKHSGGYDWGGKYSALTGMVKHLNWPNRPKTILSVDHIAGAAMLISRQLVAQIGLFDERFFLYYEDLDYCLRAKRAGYSIRINPAVVASHKTSSGTNSFQRTLYQWKSHVKFVTKYLPRTVLPTAYFIDLVLYPLFALKSSLTKNT